MSYRPSTGRSRPLSGMSRSSSMMTLGSKSFAGSQSPQHHLKRRLPKLDTASKALNFNQIFDVSRQRAASVTAQRRAMQKQSDSRHNTWSRFLLRSKIDQPCTENLQADLEETLLSTEQDGTPKEESLRSKLRRLTNSTAKTSQIVQGIASLEREALRAKKRFLAKKLLRKAKNGEDVGDSEDDDDAASDVNEPPSMNLVAKQSADRELLEVLLPPTYMDAVQRLSTSKFSAKLLMSMKATFSRYKQEGTNEVHVDGLNDMLDHLGYLRMDEELLQKELEKLTRYSTLNWDEFQEFFKVAAQHENHVMEKQFSENDEDGSGEISKEELAKVLGALGITPFRDTLDRAISMVDADGSGSLDFIEFVHLLLIYRKTEGWSEEEINKLHRVFVRFQEEEDKKVEEKEEEEGNEEQEKDKEEPAAQGMSLIMCNQALMYLFGPQLASFGSEILQSPDLAKACNHQGGLSFKEFIMWARRVREAEVAQFRTEFDAVDEDGGNCLDEKEIHVLFKRLGYTPLRKVILDLIDRFDTDGSRTIEFEEFVAMMQVLRHSDGFTTEEVQEFKTMFLDVDKDGSGEIDVCETATMLRELGITTEIHQAEEMLRAVDWNGGGTLDFSEFLRLMRLHREHELDHLTKTLNVFADHSGVMRKKQINQALMVAGFRQSTVKRLESRGFVALLPEKLSFEELVGMSDICRKIDTAQLKKDAGFSDLELNVQKNLFDKCDTDGSGVIQRFELAEFCARVKLPLQTKEDRNQLLERLEEARSNARAGGCTEEETGKTGDPTMTWHVFLHFMRLLQNREEAVLLHRAHKEHEFGCFTEDEISAVGHHYDRYLRHNGLTILSEQSLWHLFEMMGMKLTQAQGDKVRKHLKVADDDGIQRITKSDFINMLAAL
eukprot:TRINITY_DN61787_c0_g1_i1.p1 TRINITY_DN61787_c0_g1~~TRINITY_DN61787_c0_g1_i1.p1  ORF type:complete len:1002 (-),score=215.41 TRINITY_DN61787_c0_g1_i1:84-2759(-)